MKIFCGKYPNSLMSYSKELVILEAAAKMAAQQGTTEPEGRRNHAL